MREMLLEDGDDVGSEEGSISLINEDNEEEIRTPQDQS
jgi:hypothetical protein